MSFNAAVILRESAQRFADKRALVIDGISLTYAQVEAMSDRVAANLRAAGIGRGDVVGLQLPNVPHFVIAYFGILKAGAIVVPMNVLLKAPEVAHYLSDSGARALITWESFAAEAKRGADQAGEVTVYVVNPPGRDDRPKGTQSFAPLMAGEGAFEMEPTGPDDTAVIVYTSGTTGKPKGAELTHFVLYMNCDVLGRLFGLREDDVCIGMLPLFHVYGLSSVLNLCMRYGGTLVLVPRFEPDKVLQAIERERVTVLVGVPTMYFALLHAADQVKADTSSLRIGGVGGASMPGEMLQKFEQRFGITLLEGYGLSETASGTSFNRSAEERRPLSVGKPLWGVEVEVFDEHDHPLPAGSDHIGELVIRGHNVMKGYWRNPEATAEAMKGGWFHTGDLGYRDDDGFFFIVDRKKELVIRGGYNVYPREVEEVLYAHPAVAEAAVIGVPDERLGEEVVAAVALKPGHDASADEIIGWCKERLAAYKYPRTIHFLETLPKGATGKVQKKDLKAQLTGSTATEKHGPVGTPA